MIPLLLRLHQAADPVLAVFDGLQGAPDDVAAAVWWRLQYLQRVGLIDDAMLAAGEAARHPAFPPDARHALLLLAGEHAAQAVAT